jgi:hypothetical protein
VDDATIEAMRAVIEYTGRMCGALEDARIETVRVVDERHAGVSTIRAGLEGLRELVEKAAAERAEPEQDAGEDEMLERFTESLEDATLAAGKCGEKFVQVVSVGHYFKRWSTADVSAVIRAINGLREAKPTTPATNAEPTLEECVAAINRAVHRNSAGWKMVADGCTDHILNADEIRALGAYYLGRERAAKGGA